MSTTHTTVHKNGRRPTNTSEKLFLDSFQIPETRESLAELEHTTDTPHDENNDNYQRQGNRDKEATSNTTTTTTVETLRSALAHDIVSNHNGTGRPTFVSPFLTVPSPSSSNQRQHLRVPLIYCDQTASNRPLRSVERYVEEVCLPLYGNTHTNTSLTGSQSTAFVAEARQIVAEGVNAKVTGKAATDVVLFVGNGATSAVELLIDILGIKRYNSTNTSSSTRPVVFVGPYEHHSNLLPWRESGCEIVPIPLLPNSNNPTIDLHYLRSKLSLPEYSSSSGRLRMGTFSAASNVTGIVTNTNEIAAILHRHGALAFFDYATGAPYLPIDVNPPLIPEGDEEGGDASKDAVFLSPHKMIGGIGAPGILVLKKQLVEQVAAPGRSGGGTVFYVTHTHHRFLSNRVERYEGGTPNVVGIVRAGMAFLVKRNWERMYRGAKVEVAKGALGTSAGVGGNDNGVLVPPLPPPPSTTEEFEYQTHRYVVERLRRTAPNLLLLGMGSYNSYHQSVTVHQPPPANHLPVFSFLIRCGPRFLHYNYVCAVLNDLFGIQSRGGCQCSGPYSQHLLGLTVLRRKKQTRDGRGNNKEVEMEEMEEVPGRTNRRIEDALLHSKERAELLRPGYTRLSLPLKGLGKEEVEYVLRALEWVARNGWALICQYRCNHRTGEWRHFSRQGKPLGKTERRWLSHYEIPDSVPSTDKSVAANTFTTTTTTAAVPLTLEQALQNADHQLRAARADKRTIAETLKMTDHDSSDGSLGKDRDELDDLRWYVYPRECARPLKDGIEAVPGTEDDTVLGSIRPIGYYGREFEVDNIDDDDNDDDGALKKVTVGGDIPSSTLATSLITSLGAGDVAPRKTIDLPSGDHTLSFRDGLHTGEATLDEIIVGYEEGELSDKCMVYSVEEEEWVPVEQLLEKRKKARNGTTFNLGDMNASDDMDIDMDVDRSNGSSVRDGNLTTLTMKKQSRDSSSWGANPTPIVPLVRQEQQQRQSPTTESVENTRLIQTNPNGKRGGSEETPPPIPENSGTHHHHTAPNKRRKNNKTKPPPKLMRYITQALIQWNMLEDGDRLLLGLSGGKDSLSLLHCLLEFQKKLPTKFEIEVCTIDPMTPSFDPSPLIPYVESLGLKYHYIKDDIVARANSSGKNGKVVSSLCAFCARMKRGNLYSCARDNNCNKLVLAQHLDDCAESFMMSMMHNGFIRTMKANYRINAGDISVIRPLVYCRENLLTDFAKAANLPVINENCPACFEEPKERARIKRLLSREETLFPNMYDNLRRALIPIMHDDSTAILRCYTEEVVSKSRKNCPNGKNGKGTKDKKGRKHRRESGNQGEKGGGGDEVASVAGFETSSKLGSTEGSGKMEITKVKVGHKAFSLADVSEEEMVKELARRRAERFKSSGANEAGTPRKDDVDPTGQVCTLDGSGGTITCRDLME